MQYCRSLFIIIGVAVISFFLGNAEAFAEPPASSLIIEHFPAEVGNSWDYKRTFYIVICDTATGDTLEEYLIIDSLHSEFQDVDTLRDWECYRYFSELFEEGNTYPDTVWFAHPDTAFLEIAYGRPRNAGPPWKVARTLNLKFGEREFDGVEQLKRYLYQIRNSRPISTYPDTTFWEPPKKLFIFPLSVGMSWLSMIGDPWEEEREVVKEELLHVQAGDFFTLKIEMRPDLEGLQLFQWIADQGIIKDSMYVDTVWATNEFADIIGVGFAYDRYELVSHKTTDVKETHPVNNRLDDFSLAQNYPNPFNAQTTIKFYLPQSSNVELAIYNIKGQKVKTLVDGSQTVGFQRVTWDGTDKNGAEVASGIYFYRVKTDYSEETKKMVLIK